MGRVKGMGAKYPLTALLCVKKGVNWDIVELLFVECSVKDVIIKERKEQGSRLQANYPLIESSQHEALVLYSHNTISEVDKYVIHQDYFRTSY
jgi:hypothetical protein